MDVSLTLAIIGTLATVLLGASSIFLAIRRKYPGRITFIVEDSIGLFDSIVRNLPELAVLYKGEPVRQNLVLLKGFLLNTGTRDISDSMVEDKLEAVLPEGHKWLTGKVVSSSENVRAEATKVDDRSLAFDIGLFRCEEFIRFEAVVEVPLEEITEPSSYRAGESLKKALKFTHRIADTRRVNQRELPDSTPTVFIFVEIFFGVACLIPLFLFAATYGRSSFNQITTLLKTTDKLIEVHIRAKDDGSLVIEGVDEPYYETVAPSDFFSRRDLQAKVSPVSRKRPRLPFLVFGLLALLTFTIILWQLGSRLRNRKMITKLGLKA